jgi:hypothetical protein
VATQPSHGTVSAGHRGTARASALQTHDLRDTVQFCVTPAGIRAGYPSAKLLAALPARQRGKYRNKLVWITTGSAHYAIGGIRVGASATTARHHLTLHESPGRASWSFATHGSVTVLLKIRGDVVQEVGIATPALTRGATGRKALFATLS